MSARAFAYAKVTTADEYLAAPAAGAGRIAITPETRPDEATPPDRTARSVDGPRLHDGAAGQRAGGRPRDLPGARHHFGGPACARRHRAFAWGGHPPRHRPDAGRRNTGFRRGGGGAGGRARLLQPAAGRPAGPPP